MADTMISAGGGLSKMKLALANAAESDVLSGKRFYAGSKTIKEGTLTLTGNVTADKMLAGSSGYANDAHSIVEGSMPNRGSWGTSLSPGSVATVPSGYHNGSGQVTAVGLKTTEVWQSCVGGGNYFNFSGGTLVGIQSASNPSSPDNIVQAVGINSGSQYWAQCAAGTSTSVRFVLVYY